MEVEVYADPACGWSQIAVRWLGTVGDVRQLEVSIRPYSLLLRDGDDRPPPPLASRRSASLRALRIMAALSHDQPSLVGAFWEQVIAQDGPTPFGDLARALRQVGADPELERTGDDPDMDSSVQQSMAAANAILGPAPKLPVIVFNGSVGFTGPLLRAVPDPADAVRLWDALLVAAATPGFYAVSRPHPPHPHIPEFAPTAPPPALVLPT